MARLIALTALFSLSLIATLAPAHAEKRAALVIGVNDYAEVDDLEKAVGDARAMAAKLATLGFDVTQVLDPDRRALNRSISEFTAKLADGDTAFVHFSGHGVEIDGENYLLPADIPTPRSGQRNYVKSEAIAMSELIARISEAGARTRVFVIDASRDNPFERAGVRSIGGTRGLARVEAPAGTFIMYSAGYRQQALDRLGPEDTEATSVYTRTLLGHLDQPGQSIADIARDVRREVEELARSVGHDQRPAYYDELSAQLVLVSADARPEPARPPAASPSSAAAEAWAVTRDTDSIPILEAFIERFDGTYYADIARIRLDGLRGEAAGPASEPAGEVASVPETPEVPDAPEVPPEPTIDTAALVRAVQTELDRLGCDPGRPDGIWGNRSRAAVTRFNRHSATKLASTEPSAEVLGVLKATKARVCPEEAAPKPAEGASTAALSGCVRVGVRASARDRNNEAWDPFPGPTEPPDITVYDANTRKRLFGCDDSFTCAGTVTASGGTLSLIINDDDYDADDPMGQGQCSLARSSCTIGLAQLTLQGC